MAKKTRVELLPLFGSAVFELIVFEFDYGFAFLLDCSQSFCNSKLCVHILLPFSREWQIGALLLPC